MFSLVFLLLVAWVEAIPPEDDLTPLERKAASYYVPVEYPDGSRLLIFLDPHVVRAIDHNGFHPVRGQGRLQVLFGIGQDTGRAPIPYPLASKNENPEEEEFGISPLISYSLVNSPKIKSSQKNEPTIKNDELKVNQVHEGDKKVKDAEGVIEEISFEEIDKDLEKMDAVSMENKKPVNNKIVMTEKAEVEMVSKNEDVKIEEEKIKIKMNEEQMKIKDENEPIKNDRKKVEKDEMKIKMNEEQLKIKDENKPIKNDGKKIDKDEMKIKDFKDSFEDKKVIVEKDRMEINEPHVEEPQVIVMKQHTEVKESDVQPENIEVGSVSNEKKKMRTDEKRIRIPITRGNRRK